MLQALAHFRPLLNGDSGFIPRPYDRALELLDGPTTEEGLRFLRAVGVTQVVAREPLPLPQQARFGDERVYGVPAGDAASVVAPGRAVPSLWDGRGPVADLGQATRVAAIGCTLGDGPFLPRPRLEASLDGTRWEEALARASLADATLSLYRDPRGGLAEVRFPPREALLLRLDARFPCRPGTLWVKP